MTSSSNADPAHPFIIQDLYLTPHWRRLVAEWIYDAFWQTSNEVSADSLEQRLSEAKMGTQLPLSLLAQRNGEPIGTVNLVENDDPARPHLRPWLAALYVVPCERSTGVGTELVLELCKRAAQQDVDIVFLGTDNPGFYRRIGAEEVERARQDLWVMRLNTSVGEESSWRSGL